MTKTLPLFPTTVVGSMPRPQYVKDLLATGSRTGDHDAGWVRRMNDAVRFSISMQEQAGIDIVSDGEWRRETYVDVIAEIVNGFQWIKRDVFAYHQVVTERITPRRPGVVAEEARFLRDNTDRAVKICLPSPYLIGERMWVAEHSQSAYPTRESFCEALVPILRQELLAIRAVGVDVIQLDEPHLCVLVDPQIRAQFTDPEAEMRRAVDWINQIVDGVDGVTLAVHLCRRNWGRRGWGAVGGYEAILAHIQRLKVNQLMLEFSIPVAGDVAILRELPANVKIGLGCVDVRFPEIDSAELIAERVTKALPYIAAERIGLNPDCGFAPGKDHEIPMEEAYAKLKNLARAASLLRERHGSRDVIRAAIAEHSDVKSVTLTGRTIPPGIIELVPESVARESVIIPCAEENGVVQLAMSDPLDFESVVKLQFILDKTIQPVQAPKEQIVAAINRHYHR